MGINPSKLTASTPPPQPQPQKQKLQGQKAGDFHISLRDTAAFTGGATMNHLWRRGSDTGFQLATQERHQKNQFSQNHLERVEAKKMRFLTSEDIPPLIFAQELYNDKVSSSLIMQHIDSKYTTLAEKNLLPPGCQKYVGFSETHELRKVKKGIVAFKRKGSLTAEEFIINIRNNNNRPFASVFGTRLQPDDDYYSSIPIEVHEMLRDREMQMLAIFEYLLTPATVILVCMALNRILAGVWVAPSRNQEIEHKRVLRNNQRLEKLIELRDQKIKELKNSTEISSTTLDMTKDQPTF